MLPQAATIRLGFVVPEIRIRTLFSGTTLEDQVVKTACEISLPSSFQRVAAPSDARFSSILPTTSPPSGADCADAIDADTPVTLFILKTP